MFNLPGLSFAEDPAPQLVDEMMAWAKENHCGFCSNPRLWSFRSEAQRDWFVLRWGDHIPKDKNKEPLR
jgi:hypothetical protein